MGEEVVWVSIVCGWLEAMGYELNPFVCLMLYRSDEAPELARLQGKPGQLSPKARMHLSLGWLLPSKFK